MTLYIFSLHLKRKIDWFQHWQHACKMTIFKGRSYEISVYKRLSFDICAGVFSSKFRNQKRSLHNNLRKWSRPSSSLCKMYNQFLSICVTKKTREYEWKFKFQICSFLVSGTCYPKLPKIHPCYRSIPTYIIVRK